MDGGRDENNARLLNAFLSQKAVSPCGRGAVEEKRRPALGGRDIPGDASAIKGFMVHE